MGWIWFQCFWSVQGKGQICSPFIRHPVQIHCIMKNQFSHKSPARHFKNQKSQSPACRRSNLSFSLCTDAAQNSRPAWPIFAVKGSQFTWSVCFSKLFLFIPARTDSLEKRVPIEQTLDVILPLPPRENQFLKWRLPEGIVSREDGKSVRDTWKDNQLLGLVNFSTMIER